MPRSLFIFASLAGGRCERRLHSACRLQHTVSTDQRTSANAVAAHEREAGCSGPVPKPPSDPQPASSLAMKEHSPEAQDDVLLDLGSPLAATGDAHVAALHSASPRTGQPIVHGSLRTFRSLSRAGRALLLFGALLALLGAGFSASQFGQVSR